MKYSDFEKHIKSELDGSKESVQMDALLASLNLGQKTDKRSGFAFWMILPFLLITLSAIAWKYTDTNEFKDEAYLAEELPSHEDVVKVELGSENASIGGIISSTSDGNSPSNTDDRAVGASNKINVGSTSSNTTIENPTKNNSTTNSNSKTTTYPTPAINDKPIVEFQNTDQNQKSEAIDSRIIKSSYLNNDKPSASVINIEDRASVSNSTVKLSRNQLSIANLNQSIEILDDTDVDGNLFSRMKINCPSFNNDGWHVALIPEVGILMPIKTLKSQALEPEMTGFNERLKSESTLEGIELGLHGMLVRDRIPLYLKVGVSYSRIAERVELEYEYIERDTVRGIIGETYHENGDSTTYTVGPIARETKKTGSNRKHHYIHMFDIPISIGYSTYIAGLDIGIEGGIKFNFMTRATGNLLTSRSDYTNLSLNRLFKNRVGMSYFGGLMIGRNFGSFGDFYLAPRFTYYPNEFNNAANNVSQKYVTIGLTAGFVYNIN